MADYGIMSNRFVIMPDTFDLRADFRNPKTYTALECTNTGRLLGRKVRVRVDHEETGTETPGTGDTLVKSV
jgi:hypothetical protein